MKIRTKVKAVLFWVFLIFIIEVALFLAYKYTYLSALTKFFESFNEVF